MLDDGPLAQRPSSALMPQAPGAENLRLVFPGTVEAVRGGLRRVMDSPVLRSMTDDDRAAAEIVLAEVLNNVAEHAYARHTGEIELTLADAGFGLAVAVVDSGLPLPGLQIPDGRLNPLEGCGELPEGGFGWFLIRSLTQDLCYQRVAGHNSLSFRLAPAQSTP
jgi:serine/threonine-protein kinase RsbW